MTVGPYPLFEEFRRPRRAAGALSARNIAGSGSYGWNRTAIRTWARSFPPCRTRTDPRSIFISCVLFLSDMTNWSGATGSCLDGTCAARASGDADRATASALVTAFDLYNTQQGYARTGCAAARLCGGGGCPASILRCCAWRYSCSMPISPSCIACSTGRRAAAIRRRKAWAAR